jgi:hypothetical protein
MLILSSINFGNAGTAGPRAESRAFVRNALAGKAAVYDVVVYGDSSGAVIAAIAAKREGRSAILVNPTGFPGGMSASGLGATDFLGRRSTFGGITSEFYDGIAAAYGTNHIRSFEPHVGKQVFEKMIADAGVKVVYNELLDRTSGKGVKMDGKRIVSVTTLSGRTYHGKMFIDATYVGDLMAAAGVTCTVGRESESQYGEDMAGVRRGDTQPRVHYTQGDKDHFIKDVDPYIKPGDANSGLLPYVFKIENLKNGQGDRKIRHSIIASASRPIPSCAFRSRSPRATVRLITSCCCATSTRAMNACPRSSSRWRAAVRKWIGTTCTRLARIFPARIGTIPKPAMNGAGRSRRNTRPTFAGFYGPWRTTRACRRRFAKRRLPTVCQTTNSPTTAAGRG